MGEQEREKDIAFEAAVRIKERVLETLKHTIGYLEGKKTEVQRRAFNRKVEREELLERVNMLSIEEKGFHGELAGLDRLQEGVAAEADLLHDEIERLKNAYVRGDQNDEPSV